MTVHRYDQMVREYRIWIYQDMIFLALAAFELHHYLFGRTVFTTEETSSLCYVLLVELRCRRHHPCRIELKLDLQAADLDFSYLHILERSEVVACQRPAGKLVSDEFMDSVFFHITEQFSRLCSR